MINLFFSYSHRDEQLRDELEVHLAMLKREGLVQAWHDRRIDAGVNLDNTISEHLDNADVVLLLLSPYFLASDYCYEIEASRALQRHEERTAVVIPVILQPCDWLSSPFRSLRATPKDGKPVTKFPNMHDAFLEVTADIRAAAERLGKGDSRAKGPPRAEIRLAPDTRSSNLRLKKTFSDRERDVFVDDAFQYIAKFFESSLIELSNRNKGIEHRFRRHGDTEISASIYVGGEKKASCRIWLQSKNAYGGDIAYANGDVATTGSFNESIHVRDDGYNLGFQATGYGTMGRRSDALLTPQGSAELLWGMLIGPLQ